MRSVVETRTKRTSEREANGRPCRRVSIAERLASSSWSLPLNALSLELAVRGRASPLRGDGLAKENKSKERALRAPEVEENARRLFFSSFFRRPRIPHHFSTSSSFSSPLLNNRSTRCSQPWAPGSSARSTRPSTTSRLTLTSGEIERVCLSSFLFFLLSQNGLASHALCSKKKNTRKKP